MAAALIATGGLTVSTATALAGDNHGAPDGGVAPMGDSHGSPGGT